MVPRPMQIERQFDQRRAQRQTGRRLRRLGSVWTFCAIDAETKLVPAFKVGERDAATADAFLADVAGRMAKRVQISTDGLSAYKEAIEKSFGADADYAQIVKTYGHIEDADNRRYSAPEFVSCEKKVIAGNPDVRFYFYQLYRTFERNDAASHAATHSLYSGIQQEARELRSGSRTALCLLQLRQASIAAFNLRPRCEFVSIAQFASKPPSKAKADGAKVFSQHWLNAAGPSSSSAAGT